MSDGSTDESREGSSDGSSGQPGFWAQPSAAYRNFQLAFTVLTLNFAIPALSYTFTPEQAVAGFMWVNTALGGAPYPFDENASALWRILAAGDVAALAFMCLLLQLDLRRFYPVLVPLGFVKGYNALGLAGLFLLHTDVPLFLAGFLLDGVTCASCFFFATRAHADILNRPVADLVPRPRWTGR